MSKQQEWEDFEMPEEKPIDWIGIAKKIWNGRKTIYWSLGVAFILGVLFAFLSPKEYTVSSVVVPQYSGKTTGGSLSSLAAMAGIDLSSISQSSEMSPLVYPEIIGSASFQLDLMNTKFHYEKVDHPVTMLDYYTNYAKLSVFSAIKKYTIGLPWVIKKAIFGKKEIISEPSGSKIHVLSMTEDQATVADAITKMVSFDADAKSGYLTLSATADEPLLAAEIAQTATNLMQKFIIQYKVQKSKADLDFIQQRYDKAKAEMEENQMSAALSTDKSKFLTTTVATLSATQKQTMSNISNAVFLQLAQQLEQAKIEVKRDTPVFTIVQPVVIPTEPTSGKMMKIIIFLFLGSIVGIGIVYSKDVLGMLKEKWKEEPVDN